MKPAALTAAAIAACNAAGGGTVLIPPGDYLTGPIHLKSNVNLHLKAGSRLLFKTDFDAYMPVVFTRWEGVELMNYSPLIYACEQENIAITGDDCIAIKSGRNNDGRRINAPAENIIIRNCRMKDGHGGVAIGSEISGGCRNVYIENCIMDSPGLNRALRIKNNAMRGGLIENINMRNIQVGRVADAVIRVDYWYDEGDKGPHKPVVRNVTIENVTSQSSPRALHFKGYVDNPVSGVVLRNCTFNGVESADIIENAEGIVQENVIINRLPGAENKPAPEKKKKTWSAKPNEPSPEQAYPFSDKATIK